MTPITVDEAWTKYGEFPAGLYVSTGGAHIYVTRIERLVQGEYNIHPQAREPIFMTGTAELHASDADVSDDKAGSKVSLRKALRYNDLGHVCPTTGRIAMTLKYVLAHVDFGGASQVDCYLYRSGVWLKLEALNRSAGSTTLDLCDLKNSCGFRGVTVSLDTVVYFKPTPAEPAPTAPEQFTDALIDGLIGMVLNHDSTSVPTATLRTDIRALLTSGDQDPLLPSAIDLVRRWPECSARLLVHRLEVSPGRASTLHAQAKEALK